MKIFVIGCPASGKTTLAQKLRIQYNIPHYELDDLFWEVKYSQPYSKETRAVCLDELLACESWIIEGSYFDSWTYPIRDAADVVIYMQERNFFKISVRIIKRYTMRKRNRVKGESFVSIFGLLRWIHTIIRRDIYREYITPVIKKVLMVPPKK